MTDRATLAALVARVEAATWADRELDAAIAALHHEAARERGNLLVIWGGSPPAYTASLDAAVALVPAGWWVAEVGFSAINAEWHVTLEAMGDRRAQTWGATEPLARVAAALRAMMETMDD